MIICKKHQQQIVCVCTKVNCNFGNLLCQQCLNAIPQHRQEHRSMIYSVQDFLTSQNGNTKTILIPQIQESLNELERKIKDLNIIVDREMKEVDQDVSQIFKIFFEVSERAKQQIKDIIKKEFIEYTRQLQYYRQYFNDQLMNDQKKRDGTNLFNAIFSKDQDKELPVNELSIMQIIQKNSSLNQLRSDIFQSSSIVVQSIQKGGHRYKSTPNHQRQFEALKSDFIQTTNCLYTKMTELTNENPSVEDMKKSIYQFNSLDNSMRSSFMSQSSSRVNRHSVSIVSFKQLESFPPLSSFIQQVLQRIGHLPTPSSDSLLNNLEQVGPCQFPDGIIYEGQIQNNQRHGWGRALLGSDYYEGYWRTNLPFGFGRIISANGDYYEGMSINGKAQGKGVYVSGNYYYDGDWEEDIRCGRGIETVQNKYQYDGEFKENKKEGQGKLIDQVTGNVYSGDFQNNLLVGQVTIDFSNGDKYLGEIITVEGQVKRHGRGIYIWHDGRKYEGSYDNDLEHGEGVFIWPDSWIYKGLWNQGYQNGKGVQISPQGKEREGIWLNGQFKQWL